MEARPAYERACRGRPRGRPDKDLRQAPEQHLAVDHERRIVAAAIAEQDDVVAGAAGLVAPDGAVREGLEERRDLALDDGRAALVERDPLGDEAPGLEVGPHQVEVLPGVERRGALDPRVNGIARDDVELLVGGQDVMAGVVVDDRDPGIRELAARLAGHDVVVLRPEVGHDLLTSGSISADHELGRRGGGGTSPRSRRRRSRRRAPSSSCSGRGGGKPGSGRA